MSAPSEPGFFWIEHRSGKRQVVEVEFIEHEPDELLDAAFPGRQRVRYVYETGSDLNVSEHDIAQWGPRVAPWENG